LHRQFGFLNRNIIAQEIIRIDIWDCVKLKSFIKGNKATFKENNYLSEEIIYRMGENLFPVFIWQEINIQNIERTSKIKTQENK
jgi:hypothetical protein